jgi:hypothetical protein
LVPVVDHRGIKEEVDLPGGCASVPQVIESSLGATVAVDTTRGLYIDAHC